MKYLKFNLIFIFSLIISLNIKAQHSGTISNFEVLPQYLNSSGKILISQASTTSIEFKVTFARQYSGGLFLPFNMSVQLSTQTANNNIILLGSSTKITSSNFKTGIAFLSDTITAVIDNSKLIQNKTIVLAYTTNDNSFPINSYDNKLYNFQLPIPEITNNLIEEEDFAPIGLGTAFYAGTLSGGNGIFTFEWQIKEPNGNFTSVNNSSFSSLSQLHLYPNTVLNGSSVRRKVISGDKISYSNEVLLQREGILSNFTIEKIPVFNSADELIGNNIKIIAPNKPARPMNLSIIIFGPNDTYHFSAEGYEFFFPLYFDPNYPEANYSARLSFAGGGGTIFPTWNTNNQDIIVRQEYY